MNKKTVRWIITISLMVLAMDQLVLAQDAQQQKQLASAISQFDALIQQRAREGGGVKAAEDLAGAEKAIDTAFKLALAGGLNRTDRDRFIKIAQRYLIVHIRTSYASYPQLNEVLSAFEGKVPGDATLNYIFGLALFREAATQNKPQMYDQALSYINNALTVNPEFPEAYWIHSQIFAIKQGHLDVVKHDFAQIRRCESLFSPQLYLYDSTTINAIKHAAHSM